MPQQRSSGGRPGQDFQAATRYEPHSIGGHGLDWDTRPSTFKTYPEAEVVPLPPPTTDAPPGGADQAATDPGPTPSFWDTVLGRRSVRAFSDAPLTLDELSRLLWASAGVTRIAPNHLYRAAPSAGGLYPIETYVAVRNVEGLTPGLYHYRVARTERDTAGPGERVYPGDGHCLERLGGRDVSGELAEAALQQGMVARAAAVFIWTAVYERSRWKYRERAYRYIYLDAGHIAAQLSLAAVALGLGSCQIGAFFDGEVDGIVGVDGEEEGTLYLTAVGRPAREGPPGR